MCELHSGPSVLHNVYSTTMLAQKQAKSANNITKIYFFSNHASPASLSKIMATALRTHR